MARSGKTITFATDLLPNEDLIYNLGIEDTTNNSNNRRWNIFGNLNGNATNATLANTAIAANITSTQYGLAYYTDTDGTFASTDVNSTAGKKILTMTGNGTSGSAPIWESPPVWWGSCETGAAEANKTVTCPGFTLTDGAVVLVYFTATNSANVANITLNVNNTGAKKIQYLYNADNPKNLPAVGYLRAGNTYVFHYYHVNTTECWVVRLHYNTNTNTLLRTYTGNANYDYPLLAQNSSANATSQWTEYTTSYKDYYGVIPNSANTRATINLSTGLIKIPGGIESSTIKIGSSTSYGDAYTPIYWNNGTPATVTTIQKATFSLTTANSTAAIGDSTQVTDTTEVIQIIVTDTTSIANLKSAFTWEIKTNANNKYIEISATVGGNVDGYILFRK